MGDKTSSNIPKDDDQVRSLAKSVSWRDPKFVFWTLM